MRIPVFALIVCTFASSAFAEAPHTRVTLVSETAAVRPGDPFWVALRMEMDEGWHVYWTNPGDSGLPPKVKWTLPPGFKAGPLLWPVPHKIEIPPLINFGYEDEAVLLASLIPPKDLPSSPVSVKAQVDWLECADVCLPQKTHVEMNIPVSRDSPSPDTRWAELFSRARSRLPLAESEWAVQAFSGQGKIRLALTPPSGQGAADTDALFFPEDPALGTAADQRLSPIKNGFLLEFTADKAPPAGASLRGVLVSPQGWRGTGSEKGLAVDAVLRSLSESPASSAAQTGFFGPLLFAFMGGLLLNLMPCVLPVLSLKVLGFVQHAQGNPGAARRQGALFSLGVVVSFWVLAVLLLMLRAAGKEVGWGFQLQSPGFVAFLAAFFFALGLSLTGVYEMGTSLVGLGRWTGRSGNGGAFWSGVLATVVATPCTAPFMGAALGYALSQKAAVTLSVFTAMGLGMAAPYTALVSWPALGRWVPRPGEWMETLKQAMGFLLLGTTVWLLWVLGRQSGPDVLILVLAMFWSIGMGAWILGKWALPSRSGAARRLALSLGLLLILGGGTGAVVFSRRTMAEPAGLAWQTYSPERLAESLQAGKPVFMDFTAAWCLTCQVNERTALRDKQVVERFQALGVVPLKADWTTYDPAITRALQEHGRSGVPLYVLYGGAGGRPARILPTLLTPQVVLNALEEEISSHLKGGK